MIFLSTEVSLKTQFPMKTTKAPSTPASKSTELTDATKSNVSTLNPDSIMKSDSSINSASTVNSDNAVYNTAPANADNLFGNEQTATEATAINTTIEPPKQQRIGKQQRKSDFAEFKATFLAPAEVGKPLCSEYRRRPMSDSRAASPESSATVALQSAAMPTPSSPSI